MTWRRWFDGVKYNPGIRRNARRPRRGGTDRPLTRPVDAFTAALDEAGAEYMTPNGAFYVMARFDGFPGTTENVKRLIDDPGVAGMPGSAFGESRADWFRFALVTPRAGEAADRLAEHF